MTIIYLCLIVAGRNSNKWCRRCARVLRVVVGGGRAVHEAGRHYDPTHAQGSTTEIDCTSASTGKYLA